MTPEPPPRRPPAPKSAADQQLAGSGNSGEQRSDNPWIMTMLTGWIVLGFGGVLLYAIASDSNLRRFDAVGWTGAQLAGLGMASMGGTLFVAWLVCNALLWKPPRGGGASASPDLGVNLKLPAE